MKLTGAQIGRLQGLLGELFNQEELEQLVRVSLDEDLYTRLAPRGETLGSTIFHLLTGLERLDLTEQLLAAACRERPRSADLRAFHDLLTGASPAVPAPSPAPAPSSPGQRIEVFFSYSHKDEGLREQLQNHLALLKRQGVISDWHDRRIAAGTEWEGQINEHLNTAGVILLLVSADFLASDYCYDKEMKRALERHDAGEARVIPIILRPVDWHAAPFGKLQALPRDGKPVTMWPNPDEAFLDVALGIRRAVAGLPKRS
jgi:hypothetical protein